MPHRSIVWLSCAILAALVGAESAARAEPAGTEKEQAERLFLRGKELMEAGKTEPACITFEESLRHDKAGGTLLNLAECYVVLHRHASAERTLREARALAETAGRSDAVAFIDGRLADVVPKVDHLRVVAVDPAPSLELSLDGQALGPPTDDTWEVPVDPGRHAISAKAPGREPYAAELEVEGDGARVGLVVPRLAEIAAAPRVVPPEGRAVVAQRIAGWSLTSVGTGALLAGAGLGIAAIVEWNDASDRCPHVACSDSAALDAATRAGTLADGATLALGIGAASTALGVVLVLTARSSASAHASVAIAPDGVWVRGSF